MLFLGALLAATLWQIASPVPTGNHTCTGVIKHPVTVLVNVTEPVTYRSYTWCLRVPPRCSKYTVQLKDRVKLHTEMHNKTITVCCSGYVEMDNRCVPACPEGADCPFMRCNRTNHCHCVPGYTGLYCNDACPRGVWGKDCKRPCDCPTGYTCHHLTGDCFVDDRPPRRSSTTTTTTKRPTTTSTTVPTTEGTTLETVKTPVFRFPPPPWVDSSTPTKKTTTRQVSQEEAPPTKEMNPVESTRGTLLSFPTTLSTLPIEQLKKKPSGEMPPILEFLPPLETEGPVNLKEILGEATKPVEPETVKKNTLRSDEMAISRATEHMPVLIAKVAEVTNTTVLDEVSTIKLPSEKTVFETEPQTNSIITKTPLIFTSQFDVTSSTPAYSETRPPVITIQDRPTQSLTVKAKPVTMNTETTTPIYTSKSVILEVVSSQTATTHIRYPQTYLATQEIKSADNTLENGVFTKPYDYPIDRVSSKENTDPPTTISDTIEIFQKTTIPNFETREMEQVIKTKHYVKPTTLKKSTVSTKVIINPETSDLIPKSLNKSQLDITAAETPAAPLFSVAETIIPISTTTQETIASTTPPTTTTFDTKAPKITVPIVAETETTTDSSTITTTEVPITITNLTTVTATTNTPVILLTTRIAPTTSESTTVPRLSTTPTSTTTVSTPPTTFTTPETATTSIQPTTTVTTDPVTALTRESSRIIHTTTVPSITTIFTETAGYFSTPATSPAAAMFTKNTPLTTNTMLITSEDIRSTTKDIEETGISVAFTRSHRIEDTQPTVPLPVLIEEVFKELHAQKKLKLNDTSMTHSSPEKPKKKHDKLKNKAMNAKEHPSAQQTKTEKQDETQSQSTTEISFKSILHAETFMNKRLSTRPPFVSKKEPLPDFMNVRYATEEPSSMEISNSKAPTHANPNQLWHPIKKEANASNTTNVMGPEQLGVLIEPTMFSHSSMDATEMDRVMESNTIDYRQNTGEPAKRPQFSDDETNYSLFSNKIKFNMTGSVAAGVSAHRQGDSFLHTPMIVVTGIGLLSLLLLTATLWVYLKRRRERAAPFPPCIMAYAIDQPPSLDFDSFDHPFFCQTFTNNYGERINKELRELSYDHPRSTQSEPLYAEIRY